MTVIPFPQTASPCSAGKPGGQRQRLQLPVAPRAFARSRFALPGKTEPPLQPSEALAWLDTVLSQGGTIETVELAGPGDPLAAPEPTLATLRLLREQHPQLPVRLATLGIGGNQFAETLAALGIDNVTLLVDTVAPATAARLYTWIRPSTKTVPLAKATATLIDEQMKAAAALTKAGIAVTVRTTVYPGINDDQVETIAKTMAEQGARQMILVPFTPPAKDSDGPPAADRERIAALGQQAAAHLTIITAAENTITLSPHNAARNGAVPIPKPTAERPNVAVVSSNGMDIDLHLGHAIKVLIYGPREDGLACLLETRPAPEPGGGGSRWQTLAATLADCFCLLTASAGDTPRRILADHGITVLITEDNVEGTVDVLYGGGKKGKKNR